MERTSIQAGRLGAGAATIGLARPVMLTLYNPDAIDARLGESPG